MNAKSHDIHNCWIQLQVHRAIVLLLYGNEASPCESRPRPRRGPRPRVPGPRDESEPCPSRAGPDPGPATPRAVVGIFVVVVASVVVVAAVATAAALSL